MRDKKPYKEAKDGEVKKLRARVKKLEKENNRLKSELRAFEQAFHKTTRFLRDNTDDINLEDLVDAAKDGKSLKEVKNVKDVCPMCFSENYSNIKARFGKLRTCGNCGHREIIKDES
jgi:predicted nuclease with TOPRIM domain